MTLQNMKPIFTMLMPTSARCCAQTDHCKQEKNIKHPMQTNWWKRPDQMRPKTRLVSMQCSQNQVSGQHQPMTMTMTSNTHRIVCRIFLSFCLFGDKKNCVCVCSANFHPLPRAQRWWPQGHETCIRTVFVVLFFLEQIYFHHHKHSLDNHDKDIKHAPCKSVCRIF